MKLNAAQRLLQSFYDHTKPVMLPGGFRPGTPPKLRRRKKYEFRVCNGFLSLEKRVRFVGAIGASVR